MLLHLLSCHMDISHSLHTKAGRHPIHIVKENVHASSGALQLAADSEHIYHIYIRIDGPNGPSRAIDTYHGVDYGKDLPY